ncbi:MAG: ATP-dependent DNA helicase RecG, partial [Alphaproteobacteria bacterium]|nr:ATP-dependent DNA helicase RecG [Alphaproteobacteria bacterium]
NGYNKKSPLKIITKTKSEQILNILFFGNFKSFYVKKLTINNLYRVTGKLQFFSNSYQIIHPTNIFNQEKFKYFENIEPNYNLSRKKINKKKFRELVLSSLNILENYEFPKEWILDKFKDKKWLSFKESLKLIHNPKKNISKNESENLRKRLAYDELLANLLVFQKLKKKKKEKNKILIKSFSNSKQIISKLDFKLTKDQLLTYEEIKKDISGYNKMYRLIQGDVGSGKTIISLLAVLDFISAGFQCVIMVPTEILAKQHLEYFQSYLSKLNIKIKMLTSKTKNKNEIYEDLISNKIHLLIGTHSVYNKSIKFKKLGLVVIDEQHKFGVKQRINIIQKSLNCHTLIMSATPIPRSLSFALYGEIDTSIIKTKPLNRKEVITSTINSKKIDDLIEGIRRKVDNNEQVFWILPIIGADEEEDNEDQKETAISRFKYLSKIFKNKVALTHGRMTKEEIEFNMNNFLKKKKMILVSTTVIEVGINIPSATLMIIEDANRFGLSQLHQLRGRVARGNLQSHCILIYNQNLSETSKKRLMILKQSSDGFEIAEKDLLLRGSGDFFGTNQSGLPKWRFFTPYEDLDFLEKTKNNCREILGNNQIEVSNLLIDIFYKKVDYTNFFSP